MLVVCWCGIFVLGDCLLMVLVINVDFECIGWLFDEFVQDVCMVLLLVLFICNGWCVVVIIGIFEQLLCFEFYCCQIFEKEEVDCKNKVCGGDVFLLVFELVQVEVGFYILWLFDGIDIVVGWVEKVGFDVVLVWELVDVILIRKVDWVDEIICVYVVGVCWIFDLGLGDILI